MVCQYKQYIHDEIITKTCDKICLFCQQLHFRPRRGAYFVPQFEQIFSVGMAKKGVEIVIKSVLTVLGLLSSVPASELFFFRYTRARGSFAAINAPPPRGNLI